MPEAVLGILGIDVAELTFDAVLLHGGGGRRRRRTFQNDQAGHARCLDWIAAAGADRVHACLEATGRYGEDLALALHGAGHVVSVVNPARIRDFARSKLSRNKTDGIDAELVGEFRLLLRPAPWAPPSPARRRLRELVRLREALLASLTEYGNRAAAGPLCEPGRRALERVLAALREQLAAVEDAIQQLAATDAELAGQFALLTSIPGVGRMTAAGILVELPDVRLFTGAKQAAAYAGLSPRNHRSGTSVNAPARLSKTGSACLRRLLYMPALTALRFNPVVRRLRDRLRAQNRLRPKQIVGAAMRKLLQLCYGVLKTGRPFDPNHGVGPGTAAA